MIYNGPPGEIEQAADPRVTQFVRGEARERLMELRQQNGSFGMDDRVMRWRIGLMVLVSLAIWSS